MTVRHILSAMLRRWYIPVTVLACAALVTVTLARDGGTYATRTVLTLMRPASTSLSPDNGTSDSSVIAFAAAVVQETNNGRPPSRYSMADAPYYGAGIREGMLVELANSGNQWVSTFEKAEIEIHVVGRTRDWVAERQDELLNRVERVAESQQAVMGVHEKNRITTSVVPLTTEIEYVSPSRTGHLTAGAAMFAAAMIIAAWGSVTVDRLLKRRRSAVGGAPRPAGTVVEGTTP